MKRIIILSIIIFHTSCQNTKNSITYDFTTRFEKSSGKETATYQETIQFYTDLADAYVSVSTYTIGKTDSGEPLHLVTFNPNRTLESEFGKDRDKRIILVNNGIHPGESDGIDASMMLMRDLAQEKLPTPQNSIIAVIPIYNIGGALNRNSTTRTNQNGPVSYGFRGNARNYDLNRDFIKADTKNAQSFAKVFHYVKPDIFIDNHVSNGADYQYVLTHLFTQHNKLGGELGNYLHTQLMPQLEQSLEAKDWPITPYVNVFNTTPERGFTQFMDHPRYSTGYTTLWNTLGMMVETHMLKPYKDRVDGTYELMKSMIEIVEKDHDTIKKLRDDADTFYRQAETYPLDFKADTTQNSTLHFKGYEAEKITSPVTGRDRLKYDRSRPFEKEVLYANTFTAEDDVAIPKAYLVPKSWFRVVDRLQQNKIKMSLIEKDSTITVEEYRIAEYKTRTTAYEGHYNHYNTAITSTQEAKSITAGQYYYIATDQPGIRYLLETLEPTAVDSFFNWNFFDTILQQKEGFSPYVFEDIAADFLAKNPSVKKEFDDKKRRESDFANNWYAQLDWIHKKSPHYEAAHLTYPVLRVLR
ncbi:M14 family metallopeptidase [Gangjinia marincola]|uniref:M14 family metallopeptidase n=1 Tax=Gangjinia marincola TaxID=578463 RepID=A0ABP3XXK2_9FLAO